MTDRYGAPADIQALYDKLSPQQIAQVAQSIGFTGDPNSNDYNSFVQQDPSMFENAVRVAGNQSAFQPIEPPGWTGYPQPAPEERYGAPQDVQQIYDKLSPQQISQIATGIGFTGDPNSDAYNQFVKQSPSAFENAVRGAAPAPAPSTFPLPPSASGQAHYGAPAWAQGVWDQLQPWQQTQVANQVGYSGTGQQSAFNDYLVQNNAGGAFETALGRVNPQTYGMPQARPTVPQGATPYGFDSGFGYQVGANTPAYGNPAYQNGAGATTSGNFLASTPSAQAQSAFAPNDYGAAARGSFQFRRGGLI